jgi:hypothetical protein
MRRGDTPGFPTFPLCSMLVQALSNRCLPGAGSAPVAASGMATLSLAVCRPVAIATNQGFPQLWWATIGRQLSPRVAQVAP